MGVVRFHADGAPSYALQFSKLDADFSGASQSGSFRRAITGSGTVRGLMATKYVNFVHRKRVSGGLALGGGMGKLDAVYSRDETFLGTQRFVEAHRYSYPFPLFEILGRVDIRPIKYLSVGPYYGIRNGTLAFGGAVRIQFTK